MKSEEFKLDEGDCRTLNAGYGCPAYRRPNAGEMWWREVVRHPAVWVVVALALNVFEGAARKWVAGFEEGGGRLLAYFSKDLVFGMVVLWLVGKPVIEGGAREVFETWRMRGLALILVGAVMSFFEEFNVVGSALSLRALVVLPWCAGVYAGRVRSFPLLGFAVVVVFLAVINLVLGLVQNGLPGDDVLNRYAMGEVDAVRVEEGVRATGMFAYITGMGVMSAAGVWAGLVVASLGRGWGYVWVGACGILAGVGCGFASMSRGPVVTAAAMLVLWVASSVAAAKLALRMGVIGVVMLVWVVVVWPGAGERLGLVGAGTVGRFWSAGDDNVERAVGQWGEMAEAVRRHPWGLGPGTEQVGGNFAAGMGMGLRSYESQLPRIVAEFGVLGLAGFFVLVGGTVWSLEVARAEGSGAGWGLAMRATQVFVLGQAYGNLVFNHTASGFVWLVVAGALAGTRLRGVHSVAQARQSPKVLNCTRP